MKIEMHDIPVRDLVAQYKNSDEEGVTGYRGRLDIRPKYQREFVYKDEQRDAVVRSVRGGFPINVMYWSKNDSVDTYEILDGQQRTVSLCEYIQSNFPVDGKYFHNLADDEKKTLLDYNLHIYVCEGTDSEKLDWFKVINIAGEKLSNQELRNAVFSGSWLTDAKRHFSRTGGPAAVIAKSYTNDKAIRQELLETAIEWVSGGQIEDYMAKHQHDKTANPLWLHFQSVIGWVAATFTETRREMKSVNWGPLYDKFHNATLDPAALEIEVARLMEDNEASSKSGIYPYVLTRDEKYLSLRDFDDKMKRQAYEKQKGVCPTCFSSGKPANFKIEEMEGDHIDPWHSGGKTTQENCQMLCKGCNRRKAGK